MGPHHLRKEIQQKNVEGHLDSVSAGGLSFKESSFAVRMKKNLVKCLAEATTEM